MWNLSGICRSITPLPDLYSISIGLQFLMAHTGFRSGGIQSDLVLGPTARQIPAMVEGHRLNVGSIHIASLCETSAESPSHWHIVS